MQTLGRGGGGGKLFMFLFLFDYRGKPYCATCNESCHECSSQPSSVFYDDLASISIENHLESMNVREKGVKPKNVRIYKIDGVDKEFDISKCLVYSIDTLNVKIPKSRVNL